MNTEQQRYYSKGYSAGKKDKPEHVKKLEEEIVGLRQEYADLYKETYNSSVEKIFNYFWSNAIDARDIRFLAINYPHLIPADAQ